MKKCIFYICLVIVLSSIAIGVAVIKNSKNKTNSEQNKNSIVKQMSTDERKNLLIFTE